jgi:hypothetical protein
VRRKIGETDFRVVEPYWFWTAWRFRLPLC